MKKIYEFVENNEKIEILKLINSFTFFDEKWCFVENEEFFDDILDEFNLTIKDFINLGIKLADNLNKMNIDVSDYDPSKIEEYLNN